MLTSFSKLMNSSIEEEEEGEEDSGEEEEDEESNQDSDDEYSHDPSQLTAEEDSQVVVAPPLKSEKRKNIMPASPSSASLGQGGRAGLMGTFGALFSSSAMATSRIQRRVNRNKPSPEEILKNKIKIEEQLNLGKQLHISALCRMYVCMYVYLLIRQAYRYFYAY